MDDLRRQGREAINQISSINIWTQYRIREGELLAKAPGGLTEEQKTLLHEHKKEIYHYLTTPPEEVGICRRGHKIIWVCSQYGDWRCSCYLLPYDSQSYGNKGVSTPTTANNRLSSVNYWVDMPAHTREV